MRFVIQRIKEASVTVDNEIVGKIGKGIMILVGLTHDDTNDYIDMVTDKFLNLRLWDDDKGVRWKESVKSQGLEILLVSQFTLYSFMKGNKPDFHQAMENEKAQVMFNAIVDALKKKYDPNKIQTGKFGAYMNVSLINDGPVTINWDYPGDKIDNISNAQKDKEKALAKKQAKEKKQQPKETNKNTNKKQEKDQDTKGSNKIEETTNIQEESKKEDSNNTDN